MTLRATAVLAVAALTIVGSALASPKWAGLTRSQAINQGARGAAQFILANRNLNHESRSAGTLTSLFLRHLVVAKHETCGGHKAWLVSFLGDRQWKTAIGPTGNLVATDVSSGLTNVNSNTTPGCVA